MKLVSILLVISIVFFSSCGKNQNTTTEDTKDISKSEQEKEGYETLLNQYKDEVSRRFDIIKKARETVLSEQQIMEYKCKLELPAAPEQYKDIKGMYLMGANFEDLSQPFDNPYRQEYRHKHITLSELFQVEFTEKSEKYTYELDEFHSPQCFDYGELCFNMDKIKELTDEFLAHENLFVIRVHEVVKPGMMENGQFEKGGIFADLLVFSFENGEYLGGFPFVAMNNDKIELKGSSGKQNQLEKDMIKNIPFAIEAVWFAAIKGEV